MHLDIVGALSLREQAALFRRGLEYGYLTTADAIAWTDYHIEHSSDLPSVFYEISLSARLKPVDVASLLRDFTLGLEPPVLVREQVAMMLAVLGADPRRTPNVAWAAHDLALGRHFGTAAPDTELHSVAFEFDPAESEYASTPEEATRWILTCLQQIQRFLTYAV